MKPVLKAKRRQERIEDNTDDDDATRSGSMRRVSFADPATKRRKGMEDDAVERRTNAIRVEGEEETCALPKYEEDVPMEPFNLNAERSDGEGYFDGDTYIFRRSREEDETDAWLDNLDHADTVLSTTTPTPVKTRTRFADDWTMERLSSRILPFLSTATEETVLQALNRYGRILRRTNKLKSNRTKNNNNNNSRTKHARRRMDTHSNDGLEKPQHSDDATTTMENSHEYTDNSNDQTPQIHWNSGKESERSHGVTEHTRKDISREFTTDNNDMTTMADTDTAQIAFQTLSELSNILLMQLEDKHAYDRTSTYFQSFLQGNHHDTTFTNNNNNNNKRPDKSYFSTNSPLDQNTKTELAENDDDNDDKPAEEYYWEYKGNQDHKIHGPYTTRQMMEWIRAGYFVGETNAVNVRRVLPTSLDHTNNNNNNTNNKELQKKEITVDGLLHDLMDNDDDDENDEKENDEKDEERLFHWQSSDKIDFAFHRSNEEKEH